MKRIIVYLIIIILITSLFVFGYHYFSNEADEGLCDCWEMKRIMSVSYQTNDWPIKNALVLNDNNRPYRFLDSLKTNKLVFRFSGKECNYCVKGLISQMKEVFTDFENNPNIVLIENDLNPRLKGEFCKKKILSFVDENFGIPFEKYNTPFFFIVDEENKVKMFYCPQKLSNHEMTIDYLEIIKKRYFKESK